MQQAYDANDYCQSKRYGYEQKGLNTIGRFVIPIRLCGVMQARFLYHRPCAKRSPMEVRINIRLIFIEPRRIF